MNLRNKKELAKKVLGVGKSRIIFSNEGLAEIKEAITKQDILALKQEGIIKIKPVKGRKTIERRKTKRGPGKIRKTIKRRKSEYVKITRKLRGYLKILKREGKIEKDLYKELRKKIKMRYFKNKNHLKDYLKNEIKININVQEKNEKIIKKETKPKKTKESKK
jgi:large subunit ribosomal protein L19e